MIHANELMIGDWVRIKDSIDQNDAYWLHDDNHPGQAIRVEEILSNGVNPDWYGGEINDYIPEDAIEPIPLTDEILEKNGFEACGYEELALEADKYCFVLQKGADGRNAWWWEMFSSPIIPINHIHELQHILRLCGIEKEITI